MNICEKIAKIVEKKYKLPEGILVSISLAETGKKNKSGSISSWPWSLNHDGKSLFFNSKSNAYEYIIKNLNDKSKNIDVGCMQVSIKWHSDKFDSIEAMLDPYQNIDYAAKFLIDLKNNHGSWKKAIKYYHSSTAKLNKKYYSKVENLWKSNIHQAVFKKNEIEPLFLEKNVFYSEKLNIIKSKENFKDNSLSKNIRYTVDNSKDNLKKKLDMEVNIINKNENNFNFLPKNDIKNMYLKRHYDKILIFREQFKLNKN